MALTRIDKPTLPAADGTTRRPAESGWNERTVMSLRDAEDLLDWLEAQGHHDRELVIVGDATFVVRWR